MDKLRNHLWATFVLLLFATVGFGVIYPSLITLILHFGFHGKSQGSLIIIDGQIRGSALLGQSFHSEKYFYTRPSSTQNFPYNTMASGGSNFGVNNPNLIERVHALAKSSSPIPVELVTASASGLDPHISPAAAFYQAGRVAKARMKSEHEILELVEKATQTRQGWLLGENRINVLELNLMLDGRDG